LPLITPSQILQYATKQYAIWCWLASLAHTRNLNFKKQFLLWHKHHDNQQNYSHYNSHGHIWIHTYILIRRHTSAYPPVYGQGSYRKVERYNNHSSSPLLCHNRWRSLPLNWETHWDELYHLHLYIFLYYQILTCSFTECSKVIGKGTKATL